MYRISLSPSKTIFLGKFKKLYVVAKQNRQSHRNITTAAEPTAERGLLFWL
jgi:hypothetical protein